MTKADLGILERVYAAEVESAVSRNPMARLVQIKGKRAAALAEAGYLRRETMDLRPDRLGTVTVEGYVLTEVGRLAYCMGAESLARVGAAKE